MKNIQAFIFDMDGLLLDTEGVYKRSWTEAARRLGFDLTDEIYLMLIGITVADCEKQLVEVFGPRFPLDEFRKDARSRYEAIVETEGIPLKSGVREMLEWARQKNIPAAVATSTVSAEAQARLAKQGILKEFRFLIGGEMVSRGKPDPEIFLRAAEALGIDPSHCLVFEDAHSGVRAAKAANMQVLLIPDMLPSTPEIEQVATHVCESLVDARNWLAKEHFQ
jgi:HAD superfamily hydrolase (TIGR01509 family)